MMKWKFLTAVAALSLSMAVGSAETIDLSAGSYIVGNGEINPGVYIISVEGSTLKAFLPVGAEIVVAGELSLESVDAPSFSVDAGMYTAGVDFPVGSYSIDAPEDSFSNYDIFDAEGDRVLGGVIDDEDGERIGKIELLDGFVFKSDNGARFAPASGVVFD